jgi:hypothetical protein
MKSTATKSKISGKTAPGVSPESVLSAVGEDRLDCVATAAYYRAEARGFAPGSELQDWLEAEVEFDLKAGR